MFGLQSSPFLSRPDNAYGVTFGGGSSLDDGMGRKSCRGVICVSRDLVAQVYQNTRPAGVDHLAERYCRDWTNSDAEDRFDSHTSDWCARVFYYESNAGSSGLGGIALT